MTDSSVEVAVAREDDPELQRLLAVCALAEKARDAARTLLLRAQAFHDVAFHAYQLALLRSQGAPEGGP
jgi:hypothetical protein